MEREKIINTFLTSLAHAPKNASGTNPEILIGSSYSDCCLLSNEFISILSAGTVQAGFPFSYDIKSLPCHLFLYTREGSGRLSLKSDSDSHRCNENPLSEEQYSLIQNTLLFMDCNKPFKLEIKREPWIYSIFLIVGNPVSDYYQNVMGGKPLLQQCPSLSPMVVIMDGLINQCPGNGLESQLTISMELHNLLTRYSKVFLRSLTPVSQVPAYLKAIKDKFDFSFQEDYSLDELEKETGINKYRLCKEFSKYYEVSPIQYLNKRRITVASQFLTTTNYKIHEIGSLVGIDNTNHFINLFKKETGMTPLLFRQQMTP